MDDLRFVSNSASKSESSETRMQGENKQPSSTVATEAEYPLLRLHKVSKSFGPVQALYDVDLDVPAGCVTALAGDNGAGKTVLVKTISGIWQPDSGETIWEGKPVQIHNPKEAEDMGITTVYQDLALCDNLDIVQNMFLGREITHRRLLDEGSMELEAKHTLADLSVITVRSIRQSVASLSGGQRQAVAVGKAILRQSKLVLFDEPTAALGVSQTAVVLDLIKRLASRGVAVVVISHNMNDLLQVSDRIAVMHLGHLVAQGPTSDFNLQNLITLITTGKAVL